MFSMNKLLGKHLYSKADLLEASAAAPEDEDEDGATMPCVSGDARDLLAY
jgi:hypothetical protein